MAKAKGKLFVISAPSGAGKTTLCDKLKKKMPEIVESISMTTRALRVGEANKVDYFFVNEKVFKSKIRNNELLEHAKVFDNYYGTPRKFVEDNLDKGIDVLLNIDVQGAMKIRRKFKKDSIFIFIVPPSFDELEKRLTKRKTDKESEIKKRLDIARKEMDYLKDYDYKIVNDNLKDAFKKLVAVVFASRCKIEKGRN